MADPIPEKAYFRIGEVGKILDVETYVIRYWESEFKTVKPMRSRSDQRLYRRKDVEELLLVKSLLYDKKFTISGAKRWLAERRQSGALPEVGHQRLTALKQGLLDIQEVLRRSR